MNREEFIKELEASVGTMKKDALEDFVILTGMLMSREKRESFLRVLQREDTRQLRLMIDLKQLQEMEDRKNSLKERSYDEGFQEEAYELIRFYNDRGMYQDSGEVYDDLIQKMEACGALAGIAEDVIYAAYSGRIAADAHNGL